MSSNTKTFIVLFRAKNMFYNEEVLFLTNLEKLFEIIGEELGKTTVLVMQEKKTKTKLKFMDDFAKFDSTKQEEIINELQKLHDSKRTE